MSTWAPASRSGQPSSVARPTMKPTRTSASPVAGLTSLIVITLLGLTEEVQPAEADRLGRGHRRVYAVDRHGERLGVDLDRREGVIAHQIALGDRPRPLYRPDL